MQLAAAEPDEQVEIFAFDFFDLWSPRRPRQARHAQGRAARHPARSAESLDSSAASGARINSMARRGIFLGPRNIDVVDIGSLCPIQIWSEDCAVDAGCCFN